MKLSLIVVLVGAALLMAGLSVACTPVATPSPQAPAATTPLATAVAPNNAQTVSPEQAAWDKVVAAAKKEGKVTIYSFNFTGDTSLAMSKTFKDSYGIDADIVTGRGAEFLERMKTEKRIGQPTGDFTEGSAVNVKNMKLEGLTVSVGNELPALREKGVWIIDSFSLDPQDKHLISHFATTYTPWVNTNLVKREDEPKVWRDLLKPRWKGKMTMGDPRIAVTPYTIFPALLREKIIDEDFIKSLSGQDLLFVSSLPEEATRVARGERDMQALGTDSNAIFLRQGAPLRAVPLDDGTVLSPGAAAVIAAAPHPNAARLYMNWLLSPEGQAAFGQSKGIGLVRKDVPDFRPDAISFLPKRAAVVTLEDNDRGTELFRQNWLGTLWGRP